MKLSTMFSSYEKVWENIGILLDYHRSNTEHFKKRIEFRNVLYNKIIKKLKAKEEKCKWSKSFEFIDGLYNIGCNPVAHDWKKYMQKYCPYCGKEIEVCYE